MNQNQPLLSIVIPTRNRFQYAQHSINSILESQSYLFEIIVQDNSDNNDLDNFINTNISDNRLVYQHTKGQIDAIANFNKGTELARGKYITYLGDDDSINPEIMDVLLWADNMDIDAIVPSRPAQYYWPDIYHRLYKKNFSALLTVKKFTGKLSVLSPEKEIKKCIKSAGVNYLNSFIPKIYYGAVKRSIMNEVKKQTGTYFPGLSPDLTGAMAAAQFVKKLAIFDYPLFLPGSSGSSGAGWGAAHKHIGELESFPHLPQYYVKNWSSLVPRFFSGTTIWGENIVQALLALKKDDLLKDFNIAQLHAHALVYHPDRRKMIWKSFFIAVKTMKINVFFQFVYLIFYCIFILLKRMKYLVINVLRLTGIKFYTTIGEVKNIEDAVRQLSLYLKKKEYNVKKYLDNKKR